MQQLLSTISNFDFVAKALFVAMTVLWLPGITQSGLQLLALDYGGPLLLALSLSRKSERQALNPAPFVLLAACVFTSICVNPKSYPIAFVHIMAALCLYWALVRSLKDPKGFARFVVYIVIANTILALFQKFCFDPLYQVWEENRVIQAQHLSMPGAMGRNYHLCYFIIASIPLAFWVNFRLGLLLSLLGSSVIFLVGSYALILSLIGIFLYGFSRWVSTKLIIAISIASLLGLLLLKWSTVVNKVTVRLDSYAFSIREVLANPFFGHGLGAFDLSTELPSSFNQWLRASFDLGLIPLVLLFAVLIKYFKKFKEFNSYIMVSLIGMIPFTMFHETLRFTRLAALTVLVIALLDITCIDNRRQQDG
jgi:hypothetical protein